MRKIFKEIHLWLSIPFGIIIMLVCLTGACMVFETEITECLYHDRYFVKEQGAEPLPADRLMEKVTATLPDSVSATGLTVSSDPKRTWQVSLSKPRRASVYVNPYTGEITGRSGKPAFFDVAFRMHRWLMGGANSVGKLIVGISTVAFVFVLISGIVIWWPRNRKMLKERLTLHFRRGPKRFFYDLHVSAGIWVTVFLLLMALTGLNWSFPGYRKAFYKVFGVEAKEMNHGGGRPETMAQRGGGRPEADSPRGGGRAESGQPEAAAPHEGGQPQAEAAHRGAQYHSAESRGRGEGRPEGMRGGRPDYVAEHRGGGRPEGAEGEHHGRPEGMTDERGGNPHFHQDGNGQGGWNGNSYAHWQEVLDRIARENPRYHTITLRKGEASVTVPHLGNQRAADTYSFNPRNGEITDHQFYSAGNASDKIFGWIYSLHVGSWGGLLTRILAFISALIGASLPITGYYFWIKRLCKRRK